MGNEELSIALKEQIIGLNKSRRSPGVISKQLQVPRLTEQTAACKYEVHGTVVSLPRSVKKYHLLLREN